jgi:hypothetical protein
MEKSKLNSLVLAGSAAIVAAIMMLLLGILGNFGIYTGAVEMMQQWHTFFSLSVVGITAGMVEAAIITFIFVYLFGIIYNKLT